MSGEGDYVYRPGAIAVPWLIPVVHCDSNHGGGYRVEMR